MGASEASICKCQFSESFVWKHLSKGNNIQYSSTGFDGKYQISNKIKPHLCSLVVPDVATSGDTPLENSIFCLTFVEVCTK